MSRAHQATVATPVTPPVGVPSYGAYSKQVAWRVVSLWRLGVAVVVASLGFFAALAIVLAIILAPFTMEHILAIWPLVQVLIVAVPIVISVFFVLTWYATFVQASQPTPPRQLMPGFVWLVRHPVVTTVVIVLYNGVLVGATTLLFLPGVIATVYLSLTLVVLFRETPGYTATLLRSIALVYGRFWSVAGRLALLYASIFLLILGGYVLVQYVSGWLFLLTPILTIFLSLVYMAGVSILYEALCSDRPQAVGAPTRSQWPKVTYTLYGLLAVAVLSLLLNYVMGEYSLLLEYGPPLEPGGEPPGNGG